MIMGGIMRIAGKRQPFAVAFVGASNAQLIKQARQAHIVGAIALAAGLMGKRACQPGLAGAGGAGQQDGLFLGQPAAGQQSLE